jgi:hypothetical protein
LNDQHTYGNYNGDDIRRYLEGKMSPEEMHRIEKAALDDPFLSDAMEGFQLSGTAAVKEDLDELRDRLAERTSETEKNRFVWWRIAAMLVLVLGASIAAWYLAKPVAETNTLAKNEELRPLPHIDTTVTPQLFKDTTTTIKRNDQSAGIVQSIPQAEKIKADSPKKLSTGTTDQLADAIEEKSAKDISPVVIEKASIDKDKPVNGNAQTAPKASEIVSSGATSKNEIAQASKEKKMDVRSVDARKSEAMASAPSARTTGSVPGFYYKGRVTDDQNKPVPYASIRISNAAGKGTYTDVQGRFSIVSSDSILQADILSVGYNTKRTTLTATSGITVIQLQASSSALNEVVVSGYGKKRANKDDEQIDSVEANKPLPFAEPADGWSLFEIYIKNNLRIPLHQDLPAYKGAVTISFYVDPDNGRLSDFRVEKSIGTNYDKEAIRVLKEGPPWDVFNSDSKVRASYTILF